MTAIEAVHERLHPVRTSVWLTTGEAEPQLAHVVGESVAKRANIPPPNPVLDCVRRRRASWNALLHCLAVPIVTRGGLVGTICLERTADNADQHNFVEGVAREVGFALEAAHLYERAVAEKEKAEAILARVGDGVLVTNAVGRVVQVNEAGERIVDCPRDEIVGRQCAEVLGFNLGDLPLDCSGGCALLHARGELERGNEIWRRRRDGKRQPLLATAEAVRDPDGTVAEVVHSVRDITRLREADEAKALFLATASHELKTPLAVIQGFSELLLQDGDADHEDERRMAAEAMHRRAVELNKIVDRILLSSQIETGRIGVSSEPLELEPIVIERVEALRAATDTDVVADIAHELPEMVGDPDAVVTIVDHLLDNAAKYSPEEDTIAVAVSSSDSRVTLSVSDRGIGMDAEQMSRCFDQFWQAESLDVRRFGGTGLGLYIVRSLAESMGGDVHVESTLGEGTTFFVRFPRTGATVVEEPEPEPDEQAKPGMGDPSIVREFMRQIGVPTRSGQ